MMIDPYSILGVESDADDESIRRRYLELVKQFPPDHHPEKFAAIRGAYERLKDLDARVRHRLFEQGRRDGIDELIEEMACRTPRRRYGLQALLAMQRPSGR
jgi:curved DNA-binding protein CbpA